MTCQFCFSTYLILFLTLEMDYRLSWRVSILRRPIFSSCRTHPLEPGQRLLSGRAQKRVLSLIALILFFSLFCLGYLLLPVLSPLLLIAILAFGSAGSAGTRSISRCWASDGKGICGLATGAGSSSASWEPDLPPLFGLLWIRPGSMAMPGFSRRSAQGNSRITQLL